MIITTGSGKHRRRKEPLTPQPLYINPVNPPPIQGFFLFSFLISTFPHSPASKYFCIFPLFIGSSAPDSSKYFIRVVWE